MPSGYDEIPGVFSESPKKFVNIRRYFRKYRWGIAVACSIAMVIVLAASISVIIGSSLQEKQNEIPKPSSLSSSGGKRGPSRTDMLLKLSWPRKDDAWYQERWRETHLRCPLHNESNILCSQITPTNKTKIKPKPSVTIVKRAVDRDMTDLEPDDTLDWNQDPMELPECSVQDIGESMSHGSHMEDLLRDVEEALDKKQMTLEPGTPSHRHQVGFRKTCPEASKKARRGYKMEEASKFLADKLKIHRKYVPKDMMWLAKLSGTPYCENNDDKIKCDETSPYRSIDGTCNNVVNPSWGSALTPFRRSLPPDYSDGIKSIRKTKNGTELPNARLISRDVHKNLRRESESYTHLLMSWGQFIDHDITSTAASKGKNGQSVRCCRNETNIPRHPECIPILIPDGDNFYMDKGVTCMELMRSAPADICQFGPRQQMNQNTHFLDASTIYGSTEHDLHDLRTHSRGLLRTQVTVDGRELMQPSLVANDSCNTKQQMNWNQYCFKSGEARVNEHILLTIMHTIWTREHNRIASKLSDLNPDWSDEKTFQETRRIVIAEIQHITYHEFLPSIIGPAISKHLKLSPGATGKPWKEYDPKVHPGIANSFAGAAFRFGHSMIKGLLQKIDTTGNNVQFEQLKKYYFNPFSLYNLGTMGNFVRGEISQQSAAVDSFFTKQVSHRLFQTKKSSHGLDLVAINIQRGRDHGIPGYTKWRAYCGLPKIKSFSELKEETDSGTIEKMEEIYDDVEDVDLYTGGLAEYPLKDGLVGPTFACLIADQFLRLKKGDRFWYETDKKPQAFTEDQLIEIRKVSLARILCDNVEDIRSIQRWPFRHFETGNPRSSCSSSSIPEVDFWSWEDGAI